MVLCSLGSRTDCSVLYNKDWFRVFDCHWHTEISLSHVTKKTLSDRVLFGATWSPVTHRCLCEVIWTCSGSFAHARLTGKRQQSVESWRIGPASRVQCVCVGYSLAQCSTFLRATESRQERSKAREEAWNPFIIRSPPLGFAVSFALAVVPEHALLSVKAWMEGDRCEPLRRVIAHTERGNTDFYISIMKPSRWTVKVPCGSNNSPLLNDVKAESLLDHHCKYRTH